MRYAGVFGAWLGVADDREEIEACLLSNSIEARKIFRYYSYNGVYMSLDNFFELAVDAGVLAEIESDVTCCSRAMSVRASCKPSRAKASAWASA